MKHTKPLLYAVAAVTVASVAVTYFVGFRDTTQQDWEKSQAANTVTSYETFLKRHPDSKYKEIASDHLHQLVTTVNVLYSESFNAMCDQRYYDAIKVLKSLLQAAPDDSVAQNNLGVAYATVGDFDNSQSAFVQATKTAQRRRLQNLVLFLAYGKRDPGSPPLGLLAAFLPFDGRSPKKEPSARSTEPEALTNGGCLLAVLLDYYPGADTPNAEGNAITNLILGNANAFKERSSVFPVVKAWSMDKYTNNASQDTLLIGMPGVHQ